MIEFVKIKLGKHDEDTEECKFVMYSGEGSAIILAITPTKKKNETNFLQKTKSIIFEYKITNCYNSDKVSGFHL